MRLRPISSQPRSPLEAFGVPSEKVRATVEFVTDGHGWSDYGEAIAARYRVPVAEAPRAQAGDATARPARAKPTRISV